MVNVGINVRKVRDQLLTLKISTQTFVKIEN